MLSFTHLRVISNLYYFVLPNTKANILKVIYMTYIHLADAYFHWIKVHI